MIPRDNATGLQSGMPTADPDACYGLACPHRGSCGLHAAIGTADGWVIESCQQGTRWPLYKPKDRACEA